MKLSPAHILALPLAIVTVAAAAASPQCESNGHVDTMAARTNGEGRLIIGTDADSIVLGLTYDSSGLASFPVLERTGSSQGYAPTASVPLPAWDPTWFVNGLDLDGDVIAHQVYKQWINEVEVQIHERGAAGWETSTVPLPGPRWLIYGDLTAVDGDRVASLTARGLARKVRLRILERDPTGAWAHVDSVISDLEAPWFEYPMNVTLEGDVAAFGVDQGFSAGNVAVCEPDATGKWQQTATLRSPDNNQWFVEAIDLRQGRLAVLRTRRSAAGTEALAHVYRKSAAGTWDIVQRGLVASIPSSQFYVWSIQIDGNRLAVSDGRSTSTYVDNGNGMPVPVQELRGIRHALEYIGGRLIGNEGPVLRALDVPTSPGLTEVCRLSGVTTCTGSAAVTLRVHDPRRFLYDRHVTAEIQGGPPGATAIVIQSLVRGHAPALGGFLCVDRASARRMGPPRSLDALGQATFNLTRMGPSQQSGLENAVHTQGVILGPAPALTNAVAWVH